ncbi:MAG: hypothetical protein QME55_09860 [Brevundimonas sp.]|uniref:hypothetical protein n=1 Tax=Brevundimonas sp. TaxID=1871086 RepID=UPI00261268B0|nr:hypothetical protein [Brevundimonas sp.]MDI6625022.1 hypothetical protein [Brevundimonas sp.]MDQ7811695.1 hypothetical protein [Brevundimonas sp.]
MRPVFGLSVATLAAAALLAGCASNNPAAEAEAEAARVAAEIAARTPPPIALNQGVAEAAAVYRAFSRDMAALEGGFTNPDQIQAALRRGAAYDPGQISRGLVAYASILALQSPEFVAGVRSLAGDRTTRERLVADIVADPDLASTLPGADAAAGLVMTTLSADIDALSRAANSIENDAYAIQARYDPRRSWGVAEVPNREGRLEAAKVSSAQSMLPPAAEASRLFAAAHSGGDALPISGAPRKPPYPPAVVNALALAALAALGYAGENARANTDALQFDRVSQGCLSMSKLNLFQCLAASRPNYEDMFCIGRHIVRDLATCSRGAAMPAPIVTVSDVIPTDPPPPAPKPIIITPVPPPAVSPPAPASPPPPRPAPSITEKLNTEPGRAAAR